MVEGEVGGDAGTRGPGVGRGLGWRVGVIVGGRVSKRKDETCGSAVGSESNVSMAAWPTASWAEEV